MTKYICEQCQKTSEVPMDCCGKPMKAVEIAATQEATPSSEAEQPVSTEEEQTADTPSEPAQEQSPEEQPSA